MRGSLPVPVGGHSSTALVVKNRATAALEDIETIDAHAQPGGRQRECQVEFRTLDCERCALALQLAQGADQARGSSAFPRKHRRTLHVDEQVGLPRAPRRAAQGHISRFSDALTDQRLERALGKRAQRL